MSTVERVKSWARNAKRDVIALYLAMHDRRVPWYAKAVAACVACYALSPIDLIPDFLPVIGYLDDLVLLPLGILLAVRLIPAPVMDDLRHDALLRLAGDRPKSRLAAVAVVGLWCAALAAIALSFV